ncbi:MAG: hypothetical protein HQ522_18880 [Bacteroidetes bacterium]|nr:hypothetical protein [Bacteroidota bacterium]
MKTELIDSTWEKFELLVASRKPTSICMLELIKALEPEMNKDTYIKLSKLDYSFEVGEVREQLIKELTASPLPETIKGIWFGINTYLDKENNKENYAFYLSGSEYFDNDNIEWASEFDYETSSGIFLLGTLNEIISIIKKDKKIIEIGDWIFPIAYYSFIIINCLQDNQFRNIISKNNKEISIAIGYDEGDYLNLNIE